MSILSKKKQVQVDVPLIQIDKNVIKYANSFICIDNISLITISSIPSNTSWIGAIILALFSIFFMKLQIDEINNIGVFAFIVAVIWFVVVMYFNKNRGENLAISLNSGTTLYFNCKDKIFLNQVVSTMIESIKNKNESTYSISFDKCTIHGGALNNGTFADNQRI